MGAGSMCGLLGTGASGARSGLLQTLLQLLPGPRGATPTDVGPARPGTGRRPEHGAAEGDRPHGGDWADWGRAVTPHDDWGAAIAQGLFLTAVVAFVALLGWLVGAR
jgi:hypothetical protein